MFKHCMDDVFKKNYENVMYRGVGGHFLSQWFGYYVTTHLIFYVLHIVFLSGLH